MEKRVRRKEQRQQISQQLAHDTVSVLLSAYPHELLSSILVLFSRPIAPYPDPIRIQGMGMIALHQERAFRTGKITYLLYPVPKRASTGVYVFSRKHPDSEIFQWILVGLASASASFNRAEFLCREIRIGRLKRPFPVDLVKLLENRLKRQQ
jgi:hypothetical protein